MVLVEDVRGEERPRDLVGEEGAALAPRDPRLVQRASKGLPVPQGVFVQVAPVLSEPLAELSQGDLICAAQAPARDPSQASVAEQLVVEARHVVEVGGRVQAQDLQHALESKASGLDGRGEDLAFHRLQVRHGQGGQERAPAIHRLEPSELSFKREVELRRPQVRDPLGLGAGRAPEPPAGLGMGLAPDPDSLRVAPQVIALVRALPALRRPGFPPLAHGRPRRKTLAEQQPAPGCRLEAPVGGGALRGQMRRTGGDTTRAYR